MLLAAAKCALVLMFLFLIGVPVAFSFLFINVIGGLIIGVSTHDMSLGDAANNSTAFGIGVTSAAFETVFQGASAVPAFPSEAAGFRPAT